MIEIDLMNAVISKLNDRYPYIILLILYLAPVLKYRRDEPSGLIVAPATKNTIRLLFFSVAMIFHVSFIEFRIACSSPAFTFNNVLTSAARDCIPNDACFVKDLYVIRDRSSISILHTCSGVNVESRFLTDLYSVIIYS